MIVYVYLFLSSFLSKGRTKEQQVRCKHCCSVTFHISAQASRIILQGICMLFTRPPFAINKYSQQIFLRNVIVDIPGHI